MTWPTGFGRKLPLTDWEGDDFTPGAGGKSVTCMDTAVGRMAAWATNLRVNVDGRAIRAKISPRDPNGVDIVQAAQGLHSLTGLTLVHVNMTLAAKLAWLRKGNGLVVPGRYATIARAYRFQAAADFTHAIFFAFVNSSNMVREYDPLDPRTHAYGEVVPLSAVAAFINSLPSWQVGYVPLQHL